MTVRVNGNLKYIAFAVLLLANGIAIGVTFGALRSDTKHITEQIQELRSEVKETQKKIDTTNEKLTDHMIKDNR